MKVFVTHNPEDLKAYFGRALPELQDIATVTVNPLDRDLNTAELIECAADHHVIIAHRSTPGEPELFAATPALVAMFRTAVDISTIDVDAASANGVLVAHADKSFVASTAELALGLLLDSMRAVSESTVDYRNGVANPAQRPGRQLRGQTAGIIGFGSIGSYLANLLAAVGMEVLVFDPFVEVAGFTQYDELSQMLAASDVVFPLAPGGADTTHLINPTTLGQMKEGATLINVSRGELLDEAAVAEALASGRLRGVGIDVGSYPDQRPAPEFAQLPGVIATPHLGGLTPENADAQAMSAVDQVRDIVAGEIPRRSVNPNHATRLRRLLESQ